MLRLMLCGPCDFFFLFVVVLCEVREVEEKEIVIFLCLLIVDYDGDLC